MHRVLPSVILLALLAAVLTAGLTLAPPVEAGVESYNQYRRQGPTRYVVSIWEILHDDGVIRPQKRTFKWKPQQGTHSRIHDASNENNVLPGEWYGPIVVDKHVDHVTWTGSYWRQDGAYQANVYEVEIEELEPVGKIQDDVYPVEIRFRLVKRPPLFQPNLGDEES